MIAVIDARLVGVALCWLLALATSAGAEVLWERATEDPASSWFTSLIRGLRHCHRVSGSSS